MFNDAPDDFARDDLIRSWVLVQQSEYDSASYQSNFWAVGVVGALVNQNPEFAWPLIRDILAFDHGTAVMENLSAGPLKNLLAKHGDEFIATIEEQARRDPLFARLLGGVWKNAMSDEVWDRVQRVQDRRGWDGIP